ncbi:alpha-ketoglutarate-dependent dioxygenase AlkB [Croceivirga radicis]|uniref:Alpha-ketoglutarate-dependent dioxygenase AlkB n=1 Tax=Croceivirga radicis TaxID=1929488 RepID=A0A1V6LNT6_9FLAO|nr:alpha-ketoglutarate-dependent dioxygenase AlkB [Croceivirga radicis]OQD41798.1 alpha-ketoglutarate-dependent dioxygenase AlkB [Croceivirga radicis]
MAQLESIVLDLPQAEVVYFPNFYDLETANSIFNRLKTETPWQQDKITVFGKTYDQPRLTALYGNNGKSYTYSNITMQPHPFSALLKKIKTKTEETTKTSFTTCLLNLYRFGKDSNGWHADNEKELGTNPIIASLSFGAPRAFHFKNKENKHLKHKMILENGSLLLMKGTTQHHWLHQIPKTAKPIGPRINLTFRTIR